MSEANLTEMEALKILRERFGIETDNKKLILLCSIKEILQSCDEETRRQQGEFIVAAASWHGLTDDELLAFFGTTMAAVLASVTEDVLAEFGLYRVLATSPELSPVCELFFDAWLSTYFHDNPLRCQFRRVGQDAYRLVAVMPTGKIMEYPKTITAVEAMEHSNCSLEDLKSMPMLQ